MAHLIVIDDEPAVLGSLGALLSLLGHTASEAETAAEGRKLLRTTKVDLVLTDIEVPGGGAQALREIREEFPGLRIIAMSGRTESLKEAEAMGVEHTIEKPFNLTDLKQAIDLVLAKPANAL